MITDLVIASHNVRSLGQGMQGVRKRCDLRAFYRKANPQPQVILLQEHHYSAEDCADLTIQLEFRGGVSFWNNASYSPDGGRFSGGTGISIAKSLADKVLECGVLDEARAQFVIFKVNRESLGIMNVYAPNCTGQRAAFWNKLADVQLPSIEWVVAGDFNMTELGKDRSQGSNLCGMGARELSAWTRFVFNLGLKDIFHSFQYRRMGMKSFTYFRQRPVPMWSRIDRFYVTYGLSQKGGRHGIWPTLAHLCDHAAIFMVIPFTARRVIHRPFLNKSLLGDTEAVTKFERAWADAMSHKEEYSSANVW